MKYNVHAGHNPDGKIACGAVGLLKESTEARQVVKYLIQYFKKAGHTVYNCTCDKGTSQQDVLNKIVEKCNAHTVNLDISVHFNSGVSDLLGNHVTTGTEVYIYSKEDGPYKAAKQVCKEIAKLGFKNRGVKENPNLYVLKATKAQAMLIECCFVDDKDDAKLYQAKAMAQAIAAGILNSCGVQKYNAKKKIRAFDQNLKKTGEVAKGESCNINQVKFIKGYLMGHRLKKDEWVKMKYLQKQKSSK